MSAPPRLGLALGCGLIVTVAGCSSPSLNDANAPPAGAEASADAYREVSEEELSSGEDVRGGDGLDELAMAEAELARYEAQLQQIGVPVGAYYARRDQAELGAGGQPDPFPAAKPGYVDEPAGEEAKKPSPPASWPSAKSGSRRGGKKDDMDRTGKNSKKKAKKSKPSDVDDNDENAGAPRGRSETAVRPYVSGPGASPGVDGGLSKNKPQEQDRCETVCELASSICELETRICSMADRHPQDPRYGDACERATDDCQAASDACQACSGR